jgi:two-component system, NtrC family, response regulator AtoC
MYKYKEWQIRFVTITLDDMYRLQFMESSMASIMIVDNEKLVRWSVSKGLKRDRHEVFCAQNGEEAIEKAKKIFFDLVITDLKMPGINGTELLLQLKQLSPKTKTIILTTCSTEIVKQMTMNLGACGYIEKPFLVDEIRKFVQMILGT